MEKRPSGINLLNLLKVIGYFWGTFIGEERHETSFRIVNGNEWHIDGIEQRVIKEIEEIVSIIKSVIVDPNYVVQFDSMYATIQKMILS